MGLRKPQISRHFVVMQLFWSSKIRFAHNVHFEALQNSFSCTSQTNNNGGICAAMRNFQLMIANPLWRFIEAISRKG